MHLINCMQGLGDNVYARAFVKNLEGSVYLRTPWPQLFSDLPNVLPVKPETDLRTQSKNADKYHGWHEMPVGAARRIRYGARPIIQGMELSFGVPPGEFDLPDFGKPIVEGRYILVRPVTVRSEWRADSRNPLPEYVAEAASIARRMGYKIVSVADLEEGKEWALDPMPEYDIAFHKGELSVNQLLSLAQHASAVIGGIGWIVPVCIAAKVPAWFVCGGNGGYNSPEHITDKRIDSPKIGWAVPDNFCKCTEALHNCDKRISNHAEIFTKWANKHLAMV